MLQGLEFSDEFLRRALLNIYSKNFHPATEIEAMLFNAVWEKINKAAREGFDASGVTDPDKDFLSELQHNNAVFAAFKVHRMQNDMARLLLDSNGDLKPFTEWLNDVRPIASHQVGAWLRTEYDTAVLRAHQAADWQQFEREKDVLPNLKWIPSTSLHPGLDHRIYWNTVRPVDDPFWSRHRPGDRWNCKCDLTSTDEPVTPVPADTGGKSNPQPGLNNNPGKDAQLFNDSHPYFPSDCNHCPLYKARKKRVTSLFSNRVKDCYNCPYLNKCINETELNGKYPLDKWLHNYSSDTGGYVVTEKARYNYGMQNKQEKKKYEKEFAMCRVLADNGKRIEYRLMFADGTYDIKIDGVPADLKQITGGAGNLVKYVRKALYQQGGKAVILELPNHDQAFYDALTEARRKYGKEGSIYFYFSDEKILIKIE